MEQDILKSINRHLKWLFWLLIPGSIVYLIFAVALAVFFIEDHWPKEPPKVSLIVAAQDLEPGHIIMAKSLKLGKFASDSIPEWSIRPGAGRALIRHKIIRAVPEGQHIDWRDTDIPIPKTNVTANTEWDRDAHR